MVMPSNGTEKAQLLVTVKAGPSPEGEEGTVEDRSLRCSSGELGVLSVSLKKDSTSRLVRVLSSFNLRLPKQGDSS